jgi:hypothetical protein
MNGNSKMSHDIWLDPDLDFVEEISQIEHMTIDKMNERARIDPASTSEIYFIQKAREDSLRRY